MIEIDTLRHRLKLIDARLKEAEATAKRVPPESYQGQELSTERRDLASLRSRTQARLDVLTRPPDAKQLEREQRRQATIDAWVAEQRASTEASIRKCEGQGDYRQARLWRMQLITLREQVAQHVS